MTREPKRYQIFFPELKRRHVFKILEPLHGDPRFHEILARLNLVP